MFENLPPPSPATHPPTTPSTTQREESLIKFDEKFRQNPLLSKEEERAKVWNRKRVRRRGREFTKAGG